MQTTPLFEQNMSTLQKQQPLLAKTIQEALPAYRALPEVSIVDGNNGRWIEGLAPEPFFDQTVDPTPKKKDAKKSLFIMMGAGYPPYLFRRFRALPKGTLGVIVFEPNVNVLIHTLCHTSVYLAVPTGCHLAFSCSAEREAIREVMDVNIRPMGSYIVSDAEFIVHDGEYEAFSEEFKALRKAFGSEVRIHIDTLGNSPEDTLLGFRQIVLNMPWLLASPSLEEIGRPFEGMHFVCVASGPSLEKNIHRLKGRENSVVIIAADTVLRRLLEEGVRPHVVVTLERPTHTYANYFKVLVENYGELCRDILLVGQGVTPPQAFGRWPGPKIAVGKVEIPVDRWFIGDVLRGNVLRSGMSVAHMALMLASVWKAERIALLGQDLAFGEDGTSHAGETVAQSALDLEKERGLADALKIPGAFGGTVRTTNIWHLFLKVLEFMIPESGKPVYDCTEGGALIKGATIKPLAEFLDEIPDDVILSSTPAEETRKAGRRTNDEEAVKGVFDRLDISLGHLDRVTALLDEMEIDVQRAVAPGLTPERRRSIAFKLSEDFDLMNHFNPVLAFIGQSYANLSGAAIARSRWLETVEEIRTWERVYLDIIKAHRVNVRYLIQWTNYAQTLCRILADGRTWLEESGEDIYAEVPPEKASALFSTAMEKLASVHEIDRRGVEIASLNLLMARSDATLEPWTPEERWNLALFLHGQGRAEEASHLMKNVAASFEDREMPVEAIVAFFKDFARVVTTHDLCFVPQHLLAKFMLDNARRYAPDDEELMEMAEQSLEGRISYLEDLYSVGMLGEPADFEYLRAQAEKTLNRRELPEALNIVWSILQDFSANRPNDVRPLAGWLVSTLDRCALASDPVLKEAVDDVVKQMAERPETWGRLRLRIPPSFLTALHGKGLKVSVDTSETILKETD